MGEYAYNNGTQAAINHFKSKYPQYTFLCTSINNNQKDLLPPIFNKRGRPNLVRDDLLQNIKEVVIAVRLSGAVSTRKMVLSISNGVLKANNSNSLSEIGGYITLTDEKFTFQKSIATAVCYHDIPSDLIINLDQTPLFYESPAKYTFNLKGAKNVPIKGVDDKRQITATFAVSATQNFLLMQLIYAGKSKTCLSNVEFPRSFYVTYTKNDW